MSKNLAQVYAANPVTTIGNTDLYYTAVGGATDGAITGANLIASAIANTGIINVNQTASSATLAPNHRYITNCGSTFVTYTLPAGAAIGDTYIVVGYSSNGWLIAQLASFQSFYSPDATSVGTAGAFVSTGRYDCITISCVGTNIFTAYGSQGIITVA